MGTNQTIYDQPTTMNRVTSSTALYITLTYFDNGTVYSYAHNSDKALFNYVGGGLNYNSNLPPDTHESAHITRMQVYAINTSAYKLDLLHDIEVE